MYDQVHLYRDNIMLNAKLYAVIDYRIQLKGRWLTLKFAPTLESQALMRTPPGTTPGSTYTTEAANPGNDIDGDGLLLPS